MMLLLPLLMYTPYELANLALPAAFRPMMLPAIVFEFAAFSIKTPLPLLPEMRLFKTWLLVDVEPLISTPPTEFAKAALPVTSVPI